MTMAAARMKSTARLRVGGVAWAVATAFDQGDAICATIAPRRPSGIGGKPVLEFTP